MFEKYPSPSGLLLALLVCHKTRFFVFKTKVKAVYGILEGALDREGGVHLCPDCPFTT